MHSDAKRLTDFSQSRKILFIEIKQLRYVLIGRARVTEVMLPDGGGGDTDRRPGRGSARGVAAGTHHCRMAEPRSAPLAGPLLSQTGDALQCVAVKTSPLACWQTHKGGR